MRFQPVIQIALFALILSGCGVSLTANDPIAATSQTATPFFDTDWFNMKMTDVRTGEGFRVSDFTGKVVLVETMATWCPTCVIQATQVKKLHELLGNPDDLISVSLDTDLHEDPAVLKDYASSYRFDWPFAIAPLLVQRALGNLYNAEYLNPPLSPMLIIDREGKVQQLNYGIKDAETLKKIVEPLLSK